MLLNVSLPIIKKRVTQPHGQATQVNVIICANDATAAAVTINKQSILRIYVIYGILASISFNISISSISGQII